MLQPAQPYHPGSKHYQIPRPPTRSPELAPDCLNMQHVEADKCGGLERTFFPFHYGPWTGSMDKRLGKARRLPSYDGRSMRWPVKEAER